MIVISMPEGAGFEAWRERARPLLQAAIAPETLLWETGESLFPEAELPAAHAAMPQVPATFIRLAREVACHADPQRWALLYRLLWRITQGEKKALLQNRTDADVARAAAFAKAVSREIHKMHAFVRFRRIEALGEEHYVAWFEPDHWIVEAAAPFFRDRFAQMNWSILTPKGSAHWDGENLRFTQGIERSPFDQPDEMEIFWKTYYRSIFNPARLKISMMRSEMPERYWKNLPEAALIPELIRESEARVEKMFETPEREVRAWRGNAYLEHLQQLGQAASTPPEDDPMKALAQKVQTCRRCPLWERATCGLVGVGPAPARWMVIETQPGDQEDLTGEPFSGPSGVLLSAALEAAGIASVYRTYALKHFKWESHGKTRQALPPQEEELAACSSWLQLELESVQPQKVALTGEAAARAWSGLSIDGGVETIVTPSPAEIIALRNPEARAAAYRHLVDALASLRD